MKADAHIIPCEDFLLGLAMAALMAWKLIVVKAINKIAKPETTITTVPILMWYAKRCSHPFNAHHESGNAINRAIHTSFQKSLHNRNTMLLTIVPTTFRMPIFFRRFSAVKAERRNKPKHKMITANLAK